MKYGSIDANYFGNASYTLVAGGAPVPPTGAGIGEAASLVERLKTEKRDEIRKTDFADLSRIANGTFFHGRRSVIILVDEQKAPFVNDTTGTITYARSALERDLEIQTRRAIARDLRSTR